MAGGRSSGDLALVAATVAVGYWLDLQQVVLREHFVNSLEAQIGGVRQAADGQQVRVSVADPRHLNNDIGSN